MTLTVLIHTKNSEATLPAALRSVQFADEVVVIDMQSSDNTVEIAKKAKAKVFEHKDVGFVEPARNFGLGKVSGDWVLILDADEELAPGLVQEIKRITQNTESSADIYYLPRKNIVFGGWVKHTGWWPDYQIRLFKKGKVIWSDELHSQPQLKGTSLKLAAEPEAAIIHHNYPTVESFFDRLNRYTSIRANQLAEAGPPPPLTAAAVLGSFRREMVSRLFAQEGLADGGRGASLSLLQATYELTVQLKRWQLAGFPDAENNFEDLDRELRAWQRDLKYWRADWHRRQTKGLSGLWWRFRRRQRI